jgi:BASS family bile acid:Na+ symporter
MSAAKIAAIVMLVSLMLSVGLQCERGNLIAALKNYGLLGAALFANFVVVPAIAFGVVRLFGLNEPISIGILLMAMAPGAPFIAKSAAGKPGGSLAFAVALAFVMPALSIVTFPATAALLLPASADAHLPWVPFVAKLVIFQLVPLFVGMLVVDRLPSIGAKLERSLGLVLAAAILVVLFFLGPVLVKAFLSVHGSNSIWAMLTIVLLAVGTGWLFGGWKRENRRTLCIATGVRNFGLSMIVATSSFDNQLVAATVTTYFIVQFAVTTAVRLYLQRTAAAGA